MIPTPSSILLDSSCGFGPGSGVGVGVLDDAVVLLVCTGAGAVVEVEKVVASEDIGILAADATVVAVAFVSQAGFSPAPNIAKSPGVHGQW